MQIANQITRLLIGKGGGLMIDRDRLIRLFTELVSIDSPSRGEREVCRCISEKLRALGFDPKEDDVGEKIGGTI